MNIHDWDYNDETECDERSASPDGNSVAARRGCWTVSITGHCTVLYTHDDEEAAKADYADMVNDYLRDDEPEPEPAGPVVVTADDLTAAINLVLCYADAQGLPLYDTLTTERIVCTDDHVAVSFADGSSWKITVTEA